MRNTGFGRVLDVTADAIEIASPDEFYAAAYARHWHDVFRFCLAQTNDWGDSEDMTEEAYVRLWQRRFAFDWSQPALPWLLVLTRRLATDRYRALKRRVLPHRQPASLEDSVRDRWLDVQRAMSRLSELERTALVLTTVHGLSYAEAATLLRTSAGALRAAVARGRAKLEEST